MRNDNKIMASYVKNLLKQTIGSRIKKFTNAKLLSELTNFEKSIKGEIKQLTTKKLLQEQPLYKESINDYTNILRNERALGGYAEAYKVEIINNRNLNDLLSVSKKSIKNSFD